MKELQRRMLLLACVLCSFMAHASPEALLKQADSLFAAKRYTQSYALYDSLLDQGAYTPAMFLKMAYIEEGLEKIGATEYYLDRYYRTTYDDDVLQKIDELARKYNLKGYKRSDFDDFYDLYAHNRQHITLTLVALLLFTLSLTLYQRRKPERRVWGPFVVTLILTVVLFAHVNFGGRGSQAIIADPHTYLMAEPSAGASVVDVIGEGHKLPMHGQTDVWVHVLWNGTDAYVKEDRVLVSSR